MLACAKAAVRGESGTGWLRTGKVVQAGRLNITKSFITKPTAVTTFSRLLPAEA